MLQMIHSLHLHRLKTDHADDKLVCNLSVLGKTDLLQICCRSAGFVRERLFLLFFFGTRLWQSVTMLIGGKLSNQKELKSRDLLPSRSGVVRE